MAEPGKKIISHYPVDRLPADLRPEAPGSRLVTVSVTEEPDSETAGAPPKYLRFWGAASTRRTSIAEAVRRVRELRDEWD